jgi:3',5'-cyclic AMP phosphodiesterase CpdA
LTKIVVTSDLHLGITEPEIIQALAADIAVERPDLTVLAGDLGEGLTNIMRCLALFRDVPGEVAVLAGNHDVWAREGHSSQELWERALPAAVRDAGMLWLEDAVWRRDGVAVVGSLAWYDYSAVDPHFAGVSPEEFAANKGRFNLDARFVNWAWRDGAFATRLGDDLYARLEAAEQDSTVRAILVVTHVPIFEEQMCRKPNDPRWSYSNAYFGNLTLGQRVLATRKLAAVVSGHTHVGREGRVRRADTPDAPEAGDRATVSVAVLASDYGSPDYLVVQTDDLR